MGQLPPHAAVCRARRLHTRHAQRASISATDPQPPHRFTFWLS